ncbi:hypothetical protein GX51_07390 [Blastomyces parvus]|uniref:Uncharacterized protein n=1 Tax=Blastomyces parvus TaxID=2060905 RepID=A0A2B7WKL5_9EURO|nr:hypothetical protein GX51_07390 [Blastomyces parvus]
MTPGEVLDVVVGELRLLIPYLRDNTPYGAWLGLQLIPGLVGIVTGLEHRSESSKRVWRGKWARAYCHGRIAEYGTGADTAPYCDTTNELIMRRDINQTRQTGFITIMVYTQAKALAPGCQH